jgi:hypothetical protein
MAEDSRATAVEEDNREGMAGVEDINREDRVDRVADMGTAKNVLTIITIKRVREEDMASRVGEDINKAVVGAISSRAGEEDTMISINKAEEDKVDMVDNKAEDINKVDRVDMAVEEEADINKADKVDKVEDTEKNVLTTITKREDTDNKAEEATNKAAKAVKEANTTTNNTQAPVPTPPITPSLIPP